MTKSIKKAQINKKENISVQPELAIEIVKALTVAVRRGFAPGVNDDYVKWINSDNSPVVTILGNWLGCGVTRWFFYEKESEDIKEFHERVAGGVNPKWMEVADGGNKPFSTKILDDDERNNWDHEAGGKKSAQRFYKWFLQGDWLRSNAEEEFGWIFIPQEEILIGVFEWLFYNSLFNIINKKVSSEGKTLSSYLKTLKEFPDFDKHFEEIWEKIKNSVACLKDHQQSFNRVKFWLLNVFSKKDEEYNKWFSDKRETCEWWVHMCNQGNQDDLDSASDWHDLTVLMLRYGPCVTGAKTLNQINTYLEHCLRFAPQAEISLKSRNLVFLPLWLGKGQEPSDPVTAPFTAFVIANFFNEDTLIENREIIHMLFTCLAMPNIVEFAVDAYQGKLLARMGAHDLQNVLASIDNYLTDSLHMWVPKLFPSLRHRLKGAFRSNRRAIQRAENMLDSFRVRPPITQTDSISDIIYESVSEIEDSSACRVRNVKIITGDIPNVKIEAHHERLVRAIENLLLNAVQASPKDGAINLDVRIRNEFIDIVIQDHGKGIKDDIFKCIQRGAIFTTKEGGTGIGLLATRHILEAHGGTLKFENHDKTGTRVVASFPIHQSKVKIDEE